MDLAKTLIRSVTRAFYTPEFILIMDALILHSALRDDDLAYLMGQQPKHLRKLCNKLKEDGLLSVHQRLETREGAQRPFSRDYYFVDYHRAIDVVKYRLKTMTSEIEKRYGQTIEEKKDYFCPRCKSEYTQMEVLDSIGPQGFLCHRCGHLLDQVDEATQNGRANAGHEVQSRLNAQLAPFEDLMRQIDSVTVPENDFETALANRLPVPRNESTNPAAKTTAVNGAAGSGYGPATVRGMRTEPEKIQISLVDDTQAGRDLESAAERERRAKLAAQNALPAWHTTSTISGEQTTLGAAQAAQLLENGSGRATPLKKEESDEKKVEALADSSVLDAYYAQLKEEQEAEAKREREEEMEDVDDEDFEDSDDELDFEDVGIDGEVKTDDEDRRPEKRVRISEPELDDESPDGLSSSATPLERAGSEEPLKNVVAEAKLKAAAAEGFGASQGSKVEEKKEEVEVSDEDEDFEDAL